MLRLVPIIPHICFVLRLIFVNGVLWKRMGFISFIAKKKNTKGTVHWEIIADENLVFFTLWILVFLWSSAGRIVMLQGIGYFIRECHYSVLLSMALWYCCQIMSVAMQSAWHLTPYILSAVLTRWIINLWGVICEYLYFCDSSHECRWLVQHLNLNTEQVSFSGR